MIVIQKFAWIVPMTVGCILNMNDLEKGAPAITISK